MRNIKYSINEISRRPFIFIVITLQILVAIMVLIEGLSNALQSFDMKKQAEKLLKGKNIYNMQEVDSLNKSNFNDKDFNKVCEFYNYLKNSKDFKMYSRWDTNMVIKNFTDKDKFYYSKENKYTYIDGSEHSLIKATGVDAEFCEIFNFNIIKGRTFNNEDYKSEDVKPILLGNNYSGIYNVGDEFDYYDYINEKESKLKVIGILEEGASIIDNFSLEDLDNKIIYQLDKFSNNSNTNNISTILGNMYILTDNRDETTIKLNNKTKELGLCTYRLDSTRTSVAELIDMYNKEALSSLLLSLGILIFVVIAITTIQINIINEKINEFGIHLLSGATKKDIKYRNIYSSAIYISIGTVLGFYIKYLTTDINHRVIDYRVILMLIAISILLLVLSTVLPNRKVKKMEISTVVRGINV